MAKNDAMWEIWFHKFVSEINSDLMLNKESIGQIIFSIKKSKVGVKK